LLLFAISANLSLFRSKKLVYPGDILIPAAFLFKFTAPPKFEIGALFGDILFCPKFRVAGDIDYLF